MRRTFYLALMAGFAVFPLGSAFAQVGQSGYSLPLALALKAATKAIATCAGNGYPVSAVVVDTSGVIKFEAKGDHSTIGTIASAYRRGIHRRDVRGRSFTSMLRARSPISQPKIRAVEHLGRCPTLRCSPARSRSNSKTKSWLRSVSEARPAATRTRSAPKPAWRASRTILQARATNPAGRMKKRR